MQTPAVQVCPALQAAQAAPPVPQDSLAVPDRQVLLLSTQPLVQPPTFLQAPATQDSSFPQTAQLPPLAPQELALVPLSH